MKIIGLTGGIASGKSTASAYLEERGCIIIDADKIARQIVEVGKPALEAIVSCFGAEYLLEDMTLNRRKLGDLVFADENARRQLNEITHPAILEEIQRQITEISCLKTTDWVILDAALFFEMDLRHLVDEVWYLDTEEELQKQRLMVRNSLSEAEALGRIRSQMEADQKRALADVIITNNTTTEALYKQLEQRLQQ